MKNVAKSKFKMVLVDYPWAINMKLPKDKTFLNYGTIPDSFLTSMDLSEVQDDGYILFWTVNKKIVEAIEFIRRQGYV
jgi:N6-adenosine-specific RNA methylase IME4